MLTRSDMSVFASKIRAARPKMIDFDSLAPQEGCYTQSDFENAMREWKFWRNLIADACQASNWRFKRDKFFEETEW